MDTKPIMHSKIINTTLLSIVISILSYYGIDVDDETKSNILLLLIEAQSVLVIVLRIFFSGTNLSGILKVNDKPS